MSRIFIYVVIIICGCKFTQCFPSSGGAIGKSVQAQSNQGGGELRTQGKQFSGSENDVHNKVMEKPNELIGKHDASEALEMLKATGAKSINFQPMQGFDGIKEFQPAGWKMEMQSKGKEKEQEGEKEGASMWPMGVGMALMNGCFGNNYQVGDPCYDFARVSPICLNIIDAANFLGVGFDGRGYYSSESRKKSIIQRTCAAKATFMGKDVPDCMNAFGIYDYSINTETFQDASKYISYLQEKAATSKQEAMFQMESESIIKGASFGGNFGMIGGMIGQAAGGAAGGRVGASIGGAIGFGTGTGSGSSSESGEGSKNSNLNVGQSASKSAGTSVHMIAILEADLKLYELVLDEVKPSDLSINVLSDILGLPSSYFLNNADVKFQNFILRWGTHFVTSAKFGGEMRIMKTSKKESSLSSDQFAAQAQSEFAGMMSVLKSSFEQRESRFGFLGLGGKISNAKQSAQAGKQETAEMKNSQNAGGTQRNAQSEFIKTTLNVRGGNPEIAAAITEFYTPEFGELFKAWLDSIDDYIRPFEFTLVKLSSILNMNIDSLFPNDNAKSGCFQPEGSLKIDPENGLKFFESVETRVDKNKNTFNTTRRNFCKYGNSKEKFMENLLKAKMALERAETIYMAEGPFSTSNFDIVGGEPGCESQTIEYVKNGMTKTKTWPKLKTIKYKEFRVVFNMRYGLENIAKDAEYDVKCSNGRWYTKYSGTKYQNEFSCLDSVDPNEVCIADLPLLYDEKTGFFYLNQKKFDKVAWWLKGPVATAVSLNPMVELVASIGSIGFAPCNVQWTNSHRIHINGVGSCIYFQAASEGSIYLISANIPERYDTWHYIQMTPEGVSFYKGMRVMKAVKSDASATLGQKSLFMGFFVCFTKSHGRLRIDYGKAPEEKEVGVVQASYTFTNPITFNLMYFTFGAGEKKLGVSDVRVVNDKPKIECGEGLIFINGKCELNCHKECNGCFKPNDASACQSCKNVIAPNEDGQVCLAECSAKMTRKDNTCSCPKGSIGRNEDCEDVDECALKPCRNNGICIKEGFWYSCKCPKGYDGKHCEIITRACLRVPCQNGGVCSDGGSSVEYSCQCNRMFQGINCERELNECAIKPCNKGICYRKPSGYFCDCGERFGGKNCEQPNISSLTRVHGSFVWGSDTSKLTDGKINTCLTLEPDRQMEVTLNRNFMVKTVIVDIKNVQVPSINLFKDKLYMGECKELSSSTVTERVFQCDLEADVIEINLEEFPDSPDQEKICEIRIFTHIFS